MARHSRKSSRSKPIKAKGVIFSGSLKPQIKNRSSNFSTHLENIQTKHNKDSRRDRKSFLSSSNSHTSRHSRRSSSRSHHDRYTPKHLPSLVS